MNNRSEPHGIDYERMSLVWPEQVLALDLAVKTGDPEKVAQVCIEAMNVWDEIGAWPDDWHSFNRALNDLLPWHSQVHIDDLPR